MNDTCKLTKLVDRLQRFSAQLDNINDLAVHEHINHFYYMQKKAELIIIGEQLDETRRRISFLTSLLEKEYLEVFSRWRQDVRWLHIHQRCQN